MKIYIYTLSNPNNLEIKYVGKTNSPRKRLLSHICHSKKTKDRRYVCEWIKSLLKENLIPTMTVIEETDEEFWAEKEIFWIKYYRDLGFKLCNLTDGGEKNIGYVYTDELREIRRNARLGYKTPKETKEKIAETLGIKVICVEDNIIFDSVKKAIEYSNVPRTTFHRKLRKGEKMNNKTYKFL